MRVAGVHVVSYRGISDLRLPLRAANVLIGANGAGKSSLLEAMGFEPSEEGALERLNDAAAEIHWYFEPDETAPLLKALRSGSSGLPLADGLEVIAFALRGKALDDRWELAIDLFALIEGETRRGQKCRVTPAVLQRLLEPLKPNNAWANSVLETVSDDRLDRIVDLGIECPPLASYQRPRIVSMVVDDDDISPRLYRSVLRIVTALAKRFGTERPDLVEAAALLELGAFGPSRRAGVADVVVDRLRTDGNGLFPRFVKQTGDLRIEFVQGPDSAVGLVESMLSIVAGAGGLDPDANDALARARLTLRHHHDTVDYHLDAGVRSGGPSAVEIPYSHLGTGARRWLCGALDEAARELLEVIESADLDEVRLALEARVLPAAAGHGSLDGRPALRLIDEPVACLETRAHHEVMGWLRERLVANETLVVATHQSAVLRGLRLPSQDDEVIGVWREPASVRAAPIGVRLLDALDQRHAALGLLSEELLFATRAVLAVEGHHDRLILDAVYGRELAERGVVLFPIGASDAKSIERSLMTTILGRLRIPVWVLLDTPRVREGKRVRVDSTKNATATVRSAVRRLPEWQKALLRPIDLDAVDIVATLEPRHLAKAFGTSWMPTDSAGDPGKERSAEAAFARCASSPEAKQYLLKWCGAAPAVAPPEQPVVDGNLTGIIETYADYLRHRNRPREGVSRSLRQAMARFFKELDAGPGLTDPGVDNST